MHRKNTYFIEPKISQTLQNDYIATKKAVASTEDTDKLFGRKVESKSKISRICKTSCSSY